MEYFSIIIISLIASALTFFSGFGLGTILTPVFIFFFDAEIAIAMTAVVHFLNNLFKLTLVGRHAALQVVLRFGIPGMIGAFVGAKLLAHLSIAALRWAILGFETDLLKMVIGTLIISFSVLELSPKLNSKAFEKKWFLLGGLISGFFGGLSGHQGALRSAFLLRFGLAKEVFIATGITIACLVDFTRIFTYAQNFKLELFQTNTSYIAAGTISAFVGALIGKQLLKKITINFLQKIVGIFMLIVGVLLFLGII